MILSHELKSMKRVMRRLGFIDKEDIVQTKGKIACEISAGDEILLTEIIMNGYFEDIEKGEIAALLSMFVCDEGGGKDKEVSVKDEKLAEKCQAVREQARKVHKVF